MARGVLVDTNVLVYSAGVDDAQRAESAAAVLRAVSDREVGMLSTQVLSEYASTMLRRYPRTSRHDVADDLADFCRTWPILLVTDDVVAEGVRGVLEHGMSFYDAQIWATARLAGIGVVLTEDCTDGQIVEGVRFVDPFSPSFDLESLLA